MVVRSRSTLWIGIAIVLGTAVSGRITPLSGQETPPLMISEVLVDSHQAGEEAAYEWVEIVNRSDGAVSLSGWQLEDNNAADLLPDFIVPAGAFVVIAATTDAFATDLQPPLLLTLSDGRIGNGLANSGDRLVLRNPSGTAIDGVSWGDDQSIATLPAPAAGETLARTTPEAAFQLAAPSPGAAAAPSPEPAVAPNSDTTAAPNSEPPVAPSSESVVAPSSDPTVAPSPDAAAAPSTAPDEPPPLRLSEIFSNPEGKSDNAYEWVEIFNPTDRPVELTGWRISDNNASDILDSGLLPPGEYVAIAGSAEAVEKFDGAPIPIVIQDGRIGNGLANGGDTVTIQDPAGRTVDSVDYGSSRLPPPEEGRSIARTDDGWVINAAPSPGWAAVEPPLASPPIERGSDGDGAPDSFPEDAGRGVPAWVLIAIALGVPLAATAGHAAWHRRGAWTRG